MSVPHLDKRIIDGRPYVMFGPYATFSTKLLKHGRWTDFFSTVRWHNLHVIAAVLLQNLALIRYLIGQVVAGPRQRLGQLRRYYPTAEPDDWELVPAGQRAQLITPDPRQIGVLRQGTELVVSADHSIAGLLGASPEHPPRCRSCSTHCDAASRAMADHLATNDDRGHSGCRRHHLG